MKGIYITNQNMCEGYSGVAKKIRMQVKAFEQLGLHLEIYSFSDSTIRDKIVRRIPFAKRNFDRKLYDFISNEENMKDVRLVYIRHPMSSVYFVDILRKLKNRGIYIAYEFPTYPYDKNSQRLAVLLETMKDKFSRTKLHNYIDLGVNYSGYADIYKIPCLSLANGIDPDSINAHVVEEHGNIIRFLGVALLTRWNGYDRLIKAIYFYNENVRKLTQNKPKVEFYVAGEGEVFEELKNLINEYHLNDYVFLCGYVSGGKLEKLYNSCDIGVGTLNPSRKYKNHIMSSLKTKEYAAKGMPIIKGDIDPVFDENKPDFVCDVPDDESDLDLNDIVEWYLALKGKYGAEKLSEEIHNFACEYLSWKKQLSPVADRIKDSCK